MFAMSYDLNKGQVQKKSTSKTTKPYGIFKDEARCIKPGYSPKTVNTDGWLSTPKCMENTLSFGIMTTGWRTF